MLILIICEENFKNAKALSAQAFKFFEFLKIFPFHLRCEVRNFLQNLILIFNCSVDRLPKGFKYMNLEF